MILEHFNHDYWVAKRVLMDPTLFVIKRESGGATDRCGSAGLKSHSV